MVNANREKILDALESVPKVKASQLIETGFEAAKATIEMMDTVFARVPPKQIVQFFIASEAKPKQLSEDLWAEFGEGTIKCMQDGVALLAVLWQSAWVAGGGDKMIPATALKTLTRQRVMKICQNEGFLPSVPIGKIGKILSKPI